TTREEAERLIALNAKLVRADKAWAAWLVPALADFVTAQQLADATAADAAKAWLRGLLAQSPCGAALGRKIARYVRRQSAQPSAGESSSTQQRPRRRVRTCKVERVERIAPIVRSEIIVPTRRAIARPQRRPTGAASLPCELWSAGIMEKHLRFQLARPAV